MFFHQVCWLMLILGVICLFFGSWGIIEYCIFNSRRENQIPNQRQIRATNFAMYFCIIHHCRVEHMAYHCLSYARAGGIMMAIAAILMVFLP